MLCALRQQLVVFGDFDRVTLSGAGLRGAAHQPKCGHGADTANGRARIVSPSSPNLLDFLPNLVGAQGFEPWTR
jgi:hypothetical protein